MNTYIIINGKEVHTTTQTSIQNAVIYAQNYMNHSEEVIVRQISPESLADLIEDAQHSHLI
jgi:hypothetical protein